MLFKIRHDIDYDTVHDAAYWNCINSFWHILTGDQKNEAEGRYHNESYMRHAYQDPRELAYNQYGIMHGFGQITDPTFIQAEEVWQVINDLSKFDFEG